AGNSLPPKGESEAIFLPACYKPSVSREPDMSDFRDHVVTNIEALERIYGEPYGPSIAKEADRITTQYRAFIEAAPFFALATAAPDGLDCSPRGDAPGFVRIHDEKTLLVPDRRGNNRIDSLRNILVDPRVALLFLIPGCGETIRINGRAAISTDPQLCESFAVNEKAPRAVLVVSVDRIFYQCAKAIVRSKLWDPSRHVDRKSLPSSGTILAEVSARKPGGDAHARGSVDRLNATTFEARPRLIASSVLPSEAARDTSMAAHPALGVSALFSYAIGCGALPEGLGQLVGAGVI